MVVPLTEVKDRKKNWSGAQDEFDELDSVSWKVQQHHQVKSWKCRPEVKIGHIILKTFHLGMNLKLGESVASGASTKAMRRGEGSGQRKGRPRAKEAEE